MINSVKIDIHCRSLSQVTYEHHAKAFDPHSFLQNELRDINNSILNVSM